MCGILFHCVSSGNLEETDDFGSDQLFKSLIPLIRERGGDFEKYSIHPHEGVEIFSSVLSLRQPMTEQPLNDERFILQFNGELYNDEITSNMNDLNYLHDKLTNEFGGDVVKTIEKLKGEFAYSIMDKKEQKIYFGKDIIGRKSLCYSLGNSGELYISSCPPKDKEDRTKFIECQSATVYCYDTISQKMEFISQTDNGASTRSFKVLNNVDVTVNETEIVSKIHEELRQSVQKRVSTIFPLERDVTESKFAILFSGGIDCTLIAGLCGEICEKGTIIDLLNVSFSNPRANLSYDETPDRKLAIKNCHNLNNKFNTEKGVFFKLIKIDVPYKEYIAAKERVISLIYPNDTEMDLSIAIAFYFAASGKGNNGVNSDCKVLLSGLGADELFGGYTRHERIFTGVSNQTKRKLKNKPATDFTKYDLDLLNSELRDELQCDLDRLWERNLTRDDKVICCWSKEVRYPFLDEDFMHWATTEGNVPINWKLHYDVNSGDITRKFILRRLAQNGMGLDFVAQEPKRAVQFGSKSAKMEIGSGKMKGTDKIAI